jgi:alkylation response protein AidB-like acyl-CoA dehydrogenase
MFILSDRFFDLIIENDKQKELLEKADVLSSQFAKRAAKYDIEGSFPFENFEDLKKEGFLTLTIPKKYGGEGISLQTFLLISERLGRGDASTALGLGWHLGLLFTLFHTEAWDEKDYRNLCDEVIKKGFIINSCSTEPDTGSPSRGAKPQTTARQTEDGWILTGRKTWSTLSPILDIFVISASIEGTDQVGSFLVRKENPGLEVVETWNSLGMRATGSHDVILEQACIPMDAIVERKKVGQPSKKSLDGGGWMLHIPACYIGVAAAARNFALEFATSYQPPSLSSPISNLPQVQERIGKMELELLTARTMLFTMGNKWDQHPNLRKTLQPEMGAAKHVTTNSAVRIIDEAMRIVGGRSMLKEFPLERYYRDVRGGLHNPPMDDVTIQWLAKLATKNL